MLKKAKLPLTGLSDLTKQHHLCSLHNICNCLHSLHQHHQSEINTTKNYMHLNGEERACCATHSYRSHETDLHSDIVHQVKGLINKYSLNFSRLSYTVRQKTVCTMSFDVTKIKNALWLHLYNISYKEFFWL